MSILVAEDTAGDAFLLKRAFQRAGINVRIELVGDGEQAMDYLDGKGQYSDRSAFPMPSLMLLDLKMPRMDGFEVLDKVRKDPILRTLPIVILSGSDEPRDVDRAHELGTNGYCVKPCGAEGYREIVEGLEKFWLRQHQFPTMGGRVVPGAVVPRAQPAEPRL